ncbi:MAG: putative nucleotide-diphospho-sugar transferase [Candidatus Omnitrophota bacterium]|jgi:hypothetical protein
MKLYCYYTKSHESLLNTFFLPSLKDDYKVILKKGEQKCSKGSYKEEGWLETTMGKVDFIIAAILDNRNKLFLFSDPDIQFFRETEKYILKIAKDQDIVAQRNDPSGKLCSGFFACRANEKTLNLWRDVRKFICNKEGDDQDGLNYFLKLSILTSPHHYFRKRMSIILSKRGLNYHKINWRYLPSFFFGGGMLSGRRWEPGMRLKIPKNIAMHHANWTFGIENKITQLNLVRNICTGRKFVINSANNL